MFDDTRDWLDRAEPVTDPDVEVVFATLPGFYVGDANNPDQIRNPRYQVPLPNPVTGEGNAAALTTRAVATHVEALAAHYREVITLAWVNGKAFSQFGYHFWMRLGIGWKGESLSFPWYDTWEEMDHLLGWLEAAEDGDDWLDIDQGWQLAVVRREERFFFREGDDSDEERLVVSIDRRPLLGAVQSLRDRIVPIISELTSLLGTDYWTSRRSDVPGTAERQPEPPEPAVPGFWSRLWKRS
jgi:hypothetical protein